MDSLLKPCFGYKLRTGTVVIGVLQVVFAGTAAIFYSAGLITLACIDNTEDVRSFHNNFRIPFVDVQHASSHTIRGALTGIFIVALVSCVVVMGFGSFLLLSLKRKGNQRHVKIWLISEGSLLLLAILYVLTVTISGYTSLGLAVSDVVSTGMHSYFFWVVFQYWKEVKVEEIASGTITMTKIHTDNLQLDTSTTNANSQL